MVATMLLVGGTVDSHNNPRHVEKSYTDMGEIGVHKNKAITTLRPK